MNRTRAVLTLTLIALALIAAGCGGDEEETSTEVADEALAIEEFITQADEICKAENATIDAAAAELGSGQPSEAEVETFADDLLLPGLQAQHDAIAALTPPAEEADTVEQLLTELQSGIDAVEADPSLLISSGADAEFAEANRLAAELGLRECGEE